MKFIVNILFVICTVILIGYAVENIDITLPGSNKEECSDLEDDIRSGQLDTSYRVLLSDLYKEAKLLKNKLTYDYEKQIDSSKIIKSTNLQSQEKKEVEQDKD
ncbi:hypothetical protein [Aquimarina sp. RZ0]|uniref:hypothetical protein n=1 Tax=Aquimarina sp. RZ0 TaxID=2607730 RepID=UPI0011F3C097|nr:hypothetical protein [Aquimarina sp. RZ0]KAA1242577.1 hypothetical protein F0000_24980 [Aquimarina sp. RZ0]